jgi:20S proteasome alpha/beta subunit
VWEVLTSNKNVSNAKRLLICSSLARDKLAAVRDKRDRRKKKFIATLTAQGTVFHAAKAAGVSRWTAYRWRQEDLDFADQWDEAIENAVDAVENVIYRRALGGDTIAAIFYLKAQRPKFRDRLNINVEQVQSEIEERMTQLQSALVARAVPALTD